MNIRDLEYAVTLHKLGHFGKAAKACFVSQPTLSGQFKKLEKELGILLLDRSAKGVVFTEAGLDFLERAKRILNEVELIEETAKMMKDPLGGKMHIGIIPSLCSYFLPHVIAPLRKAFPKMHFRFYEHKTEHILKELEEGQIDAGILALPLHQDSFIEKPLFRESFLYSVAKDHPKAKAQKIKEQEFSGDHILLLSEGHCFGDQALSVCSKYSSRGEMNGTSLETLINMVAMNEGVTLVPELASLHYENRKDISFIPIENPIPQREIGMIFRKHSPRAELFDKIRQHIKPEIDQLLSKNKKQKKLIPVDF